MKKDVIYIDVEDDITAVIGKVKASDEKIVALVPPKRVGILQSAVNLRLLARSATQADKHLVLITNNQALSALAASATIPVAKNLQSKPELAEIPALDIDDGDDVIDGAQLPVGEHVAAASAVKKGESDADDALLEGISVDEPTEASKQAVPSAARSAAGVSKSKKTGSPNKVPNFNTFRKKMIIIIVSAVLLIGVLIWAIFFAPSATVIIKARTSSVPVSNVAQLGARTDSAASLLESTTQSKEQDVSVEFEGTGKQDVGEKATGTVRFSTGAISNLGLTIPAGTALTSASGSVFRTTESVTFSISNYGGVNAGVIAAESGENYNAASGSVSGAPSGVSASLTGPTSGGTTKEITIVTAADVQAASEKLVQQSGDSVKSELQGGFGNDVTVIPDSFTVDRAAAASNPAVGKEVNGKATLTSKVTYRMVGVSTKSLDEYLTGLLKEQLEDQKAQKVYETGAKAIQFTEFARRGDTASVRIATTGNVGPVIDEDAVKEQVAGKRLGDVQPELEQIDGVESVDVKFPFFWVRTIPNNTDKITIEFDIENASS